MHSHTLGADARLLALLCLTACGGELTALPVLSLGPEVTEVFSTGYSGIGSSQRLVLTNQNQWAALWAAIHATANPVPSRPNVDLDRHELIAVALGTRPSGGYGIHIDSVRASSGGREVFLTTSRPGPRCVTTQALTQPVHIVGVPAAGGSTRFIERDEEIDCE